MNAVVAPRIFLEDGIETVSREGGGLLEIVVVRRAEARRLLQRASNGDRAAQQVLVAVNDFQRAIDDAPADQLKRCAGCRAPLRRHQHNFVVALPAVESRSTAITIAVCTGCATDRSTIRRKGMLGLELVWPGLRELVVTHLHGGRA